ncbi:Protein-L-isoaspartate O-methyltransferase domain-containing protein 1 [Armadillidium nasatum]|uniref:Protein-L-isoaspartate O-methyltransferase domain-containing protein 1 n=1 Tax=Armadillidium nasatum TaxID=96803 RepID=A0A5N5TNW0_9CRUS|nr:Protein-L-isoaspartate O-methyltransferase domain-containing protein 1 [Armadillidium nasatum]
MVYPMRTNPSVIMGGVVSAGVDNDDLVDKLKEADYIKTENVEKIFRLVDRGCYMTKDSQSIAYRDNAWRNGNLHISAPCIYAQYLHVEDIKIYFEVMEGLKLGPGMSFLNLGSGTGYLSTMAGLIIGPTGINHGVELHGDVVEYARERLAWFLANTGSVDVSFFCEPQFSQGNALCIKEEKMLYDRVYCGASCPSSHENYMKNLIKVNGILVMPRNDKLLKIVRTGENSWCTESLLPVSFSSLIMPDNSLTAEEVELRTLDSSTKGINRYLSSLLGNAQYLVFQNQIWW